MPKHKDRAMLIEKISSKHSYRDDYKSDYSLELYDYHTKQLDQNLFAKLPNKMQNKVSYNDSTNSNKEDELLPEKINKNKSKKSEKDKHSRSKKDKSKVLSLVDYGIESSESESSYKKNQDEKYIRSYDQKLINSRYYDSHEYESNYDKKSKEINNKLLEYLPGPPLPPDYESNEKLIISNHSKKSKKDKKMYKEYRQDKEISEKSNKLEVSNSKKHNKSNKIQNEQENLKHKDINKLKHMKIEHMKKYSTHVSKRHPELRDTDDETMENVEKSIKLRPNLNKKHKEHKYVEEEYPPLPPVSPEYSMEDKLFNKKHKASKPQVLMKSEIKNSNSQSLKNEYEDVSSDDGKLENVNSYKKIKSKIQTYSKLNAESNLKSNKKNKIDEEIREKSEKSRKKNESNNKSNHDSKKIKNNIPETLAVEKKLKRRHKYSESSDKNDYSDNTDEKIVSLNCDNYINSKDSKKKKVPTATLR